MPSIRHSASETAAKTNNQQQQNQANNHQQSQANQTFKMEPIDRYSLVFIIFVVHGIGTLLPWNMLITADSYFVDYKLNVTSNSTALNNYRNNFLSYLGIASKAPNILLQIFNLFVASKSSALLTRINISLIIQAAIFGLTIYLAIIDTESWPVGFFWVTMLSAAVINMANGVYQGCVYGGVARLSMKYTNAVTLGMNISGTLSAVLMIVSLLLSPHPRNIAIYFFSSAVVYQLVSIGTVFVLKKNKYYNHHIDPDLKIGNEIALEDLSIEKGKKEPEKVELTGVKKYTFVFSRIWPQLFNIILVYFVSLSLFPAVQANIRPLNSIMPNRFFAPVTCFLSFNLFAAIGNYFAQVLPKVPKNRIVWLMLARFLIIPFFLFCNYKPDQRFWPVYIRSDYVYIFGGIIMATSHGWLSSLAIMYVPKCVDQSMAPTAGMLSALTIIIGILIGINSSLIYPELIATRWFG